MRRVCTAPFHSVNDSPDCASPPPSSSCSTGDAVCSSNQKFQRAKINAAKPFYENRYHRWRRRRRRADNDWSDVGARTGRRPTVYCPEDCTWRAYPIRASRSPLKKKKKNLLSDLVPEREEGARRGRGNSGAAYPCVYVMLRRAVLTVLRCIVLTLERAYTFNPFL